MFALRLRVGKHFLKQLLQISPRKQFVKLTGDEVHFDFPLSWTPSIASEVNDAHGLFSCYNIKYIIKWNDAVPSSHSLEGSVRDFVFVKRTQNTQLILVLKFWYYFVFRAIGGYYWEYYCRNYSRKEHKYKNNNLSYRCHYLILHFDTTLKYTLIDCIIKYYIML